MTNLTTPTTKSVKVKRDYLTEEEIRTLIEIAKNDGRHGKRNALLLLVMYRHGLRVSEAIDLTWDQIDFTRGSILIHRKKNGLASNQPLSGKELRELRSIKRNTKSHHVFVSERGSPMTSSNIRMIFSRLRERVLSRPYLGTITGPIHAHALRHACGHKLADEGIDTRRIQDYLGHKNIQNTQRYTQLSANKFRGFDKLI